MGNGKKNKASANIDENTGSFKDKLPARADFFENVATAIIKEAAKEYVLAIAHRNYKEIAENEKFFRSKHFAKLTDINPDYLMRELQWKAYDKYGVQYRRIMAKLEGEKKNDNYQQLK